MFGIQAGKELCLLSNNIVNHGIKEKKIWCPIIKDRVNINMGGYDGAQGLLFACQYDGTYKSNGMR